METTIEQPQHILEEVSGDDLVLLDIDGEVHEEYESFEENELEDNEYKTTEEKEWEDDKMKQARRNRLLDYN